MFNELCIAEEQIGLTLLPMEAPVKVMVINHVETPSKTNAAMQHFRALPIGRLVTVKSP